MAASDYWNAFKSGASNLATAYDNKVKENQKKEYQKRLLLDQRYGTNLAKGMYQGDYNLRKFAKDISPVGAAINMGSALEEGDYKTAGLNAALLGAEALPFGKLAGPLAKRVYNAAVDSDYRSIGDILGNPVSMPNKAAGAMAIDEQGLFPISDHLLRKSPFAIKRNLSPATHDLIYTSNDPNIIDSIYDYGTKRNVYLTDDPFISAQYGPNTLAVAVPKFNKDFDVGLSGTIGVGPLSNKATQGARETIMEPGMFNRLLDEDLVLNMGTDLRNNLDKFRLPDDRKKAIADAYAKRAALFESIF